MLINAVKDVATALGDLIQATKAASGKNINDPSMNELKESAKVNFGNKYFLIFLKYQSLNYVYLLHFYRLWLLMLLHF